MFTTSDPTVVHETLAAVIAQNFQPMIQAEIDRIVRHAKESAKAQIEREVRDLAWSLESQIARLSNRLKSKITFEFKVTLPEGW